MFNVFNINPPIQKYAITINTEACFVDTKDNKLGNTDNRSRKFWWH